MACSQFPDAEITSTWLPPVKDVERSYWEGDVQGDGWVVKEHPFACLLFVCFLSFSFSFFPLFHSWVFENWLFCADNIHQRVSSRLLSHKKALLTRRLCKCKTKSKGNLRFRWCPAQKPGLVSLMVTPRWQVSSHATYICREQRLPS